ncbi:PstS family phosphate ABC transporter substrate-binding protein [Halomonas eurihalina]|uniref:Phosphate-binding protein n=1 Tax=Halomonas eurihalina TaxID=42566 RepID=A0A5D9D4J0_HALER|nr:PstS family phosphate ABC transporter substrate-binding protein [Halomonas eurihalina]MDR5859682.1 PstS family phosphate ABC transporter substrate-binding protein [Halomonas eurihalina]TZG39138.1 PstS family phosphate ABC transporter substrate-binding protein [Halomonas eurihalina]
MKRAMAGGICFAMLLGLGPAASSWAQETVRADGSSTVYPITQEAERRYAHNAGVEVDVQYSGTTGGFRRFCAGETQINDASRPINREELKACAESDVEFVELPIALDALSVVVHSDNDWAEEITIEELRRLWEPAAEDSVMTWQQVRPEWPDRPIRLFGRGQDSGTYDFFTSVIVGETRASRHDYVASENEEALVEGIMLDREALGFFGVGAYFRHWENLQDLAIDAGDGPVHPSLNAVREGRYPLARPLFLYVNAGALRNDPQLQAFLEAYLDGLSNWVHFTGYMPLPEAAYDDAKKRLASMTTGSRFAGELQVGTDINNWGK